MEAASRAAPRRPRPNSVEAAFPAGEPRPFDLARVTGQRQLRAGRQLRQPLQPVPPVRLEPVRIGVAGLDAVAEGDRQLGQRGGRVGVQRRDVGSTIMMLSASMTRKSRLMPSDAA